MEFKKVMSWVSDDKPETTPAVVVVSRCGSVVKRLPFRCWSKKNSCYSNYKEHVYSQSSNRGKQRHEHQNEGKGKYLSVMVNGKLRSVHRLVASAWIPNPENKPQVNHIDGNRSNNQASNLEWVTNSENASHAKLTGITASRNQQKSHVSSMGAEMKAMRLSGMSTVDIGSVFGVSHETVRKYTLACATEQEKKQMKTIEGKLRWESRRNGGI